MVFVQVTSAQPYLLVRIRREAGRIFREDTGGIDDMV